MRVVQLTRVRLRLWFRIMAGGSWTGSPPAFRHCQKWLPPSMGGRKSWLMAAFVAVVTLSKLCASEPARFSSAVLTGTDWRLRAKRELLALLRSFAAVLSVRSGCLAHAVWQT